MNLKYGNISLIRLDAFSRQLRDRFDEVVKQASDIRLTTSDKVTHQAVVAFEKPIDTLEPTINKRTPLIGTAGPAKRKRDDDLVDPALDDQRYATAKHVRDLSYLIG